MEVKDDFPGERPAQIVLEAMKAKRYLVALGFVLAAQGVHADIVRIAVASNFASVATILKQKFEQGSGHQVTLIPGSTGKLYAQILNGAPFDIFLSADQERPLRLEEKGMTIPGGRFTYAIGQLMLCSSRLDMFEASESADFFTRSDIYHIAVPNPEVAPFGAAAVEFLTNLGAYPQVSSKIVLAENVGQSYAFIAMGNAELGFVSRSQVLEKKGVDCRMVPEDRHQPIKQDIVALRNAKDNEAATAFISFLKEPLARAEIMNSGYRVPAL